MHQAAGINECSGVLLKRNFIQHGSPGVLQMSITQPFIQGLREAGFPSSPIKVMPTHMPLFGILRQTQHLPHQFNNTKSFPHTSPICCPIHMQ